MRPQVLITRSEPGASRTAARLEALGHDAIVSPLAVREALMTAEALNAALTGAPALALTSAHAARALAATDLDRDTPVFAVGDATAGAASEAGFTAVESAARDVAALARLIERAGVTGVVHVRGEETAGDLSAELSQAGAAVVEAIAYRMIPAEALSAGAEAALRAREIAAVLIHSPSGARRYLSLAQTAGLGEAARATPAAAISEAAATPLRQAGLTTIAVASAPDEAGLMEALGDLVGARRA